MKLKRPRPVVIIRKRVRKFRGGDKAVASQYKEALESLPNITNETVTEHREEVLSSARKYIYPLQHSKHKVVLISSTLLGLLVVGFFVYTGLALYKFQDYSSFIYDVTKVLPFPVAKAGPSYVSYESYLFELKHYIHYYQVQQKIDFNTVRGQQQLDSYKKEALQEVIDDAYIKQLSSKYHVSVSPTEVDNEVNLLRTENLLGDNDQVFASVLSQYWGWTINDFKHELQQQLLAQKLVSTLDTQANQSAQAAYQQLVAGVSFTDVVQTYSDDNTTKNNGGEFGFLISKDNQNLAPQTLNVLFTLKAGQVSNIINIGTGLEIVKVISIQGNQVQAAHILINYNSVNTYINPLEKQKPAEYFIHVN